MTMIMVMMMTIMMIMMMMIMMMTIKMAIALPNLKLGAPDFAWQQIQLIPTDDYNDRGNDDVDSDGNGDDNEHDDEDHNGHNSANFQAMSFRLCMIIDLDIT